MGKYHDGTYISTSGKCTNPGGIVKYRSSYEHAFAKICDDAQIVESWSYETYYIGYRYRNKPHHYLVDFFIKLTDGRHLLIEIKPKTFYDKAMLRHDMNWHKWNASISFCKKKNWEFKVLTEITIPILRQAWLGY